MTHPERLGILGGTLDPIHTGHLDAALAAVRALGLDRVLLMPSHVPPHRQIQPMASSYHRFAMTALAVNGVRNLEASDMELRAAGPTYTADTLARLHALGVSPVQIFFITGADAFAEIATWSRYPHVLDMAHFAVVSRSGYPAGDLASRLPELAERMVAARPDLDLTRDCSILLVNERTADVSSTDIRRRIRSGEPVHGLVPAAVEAHIRQHNLYSAEQPPDPLITAADHLHGQD